MSIKFEFIGSKLQISDNGSVVESIEKDSGEGGIFYDWEQKQKKTMT